MKALKIFSSATDKEQGSALIIVTLLLALLTIYVTASLTVSTSDAVAANFEVAQKVGFYTAYSKMEQMSRDFSALFLTSPNPRYDTLCRVVIADPTLLNQFRIVKPDVNCPTGSPCTPNYSGRYMSGTNLFDLGWVNAPTPFCIVDVCNPTATPLCNFPIRPPNTTQVSTGEFAGLQGFARRYRMAVTTTSENRGGADVQITRDFDNYLLPLFQFGIFTDSDFELYIPPNWAFGGWVHTNSDFYLTGGNAAGSTPRSTFSRYIFDAGGNLVKTGAQITVAKHIVIGNEKNGSAVANSYMRVFQDATNFVNISTSSSTGGGRAPVNCQGIGDPSFDAAPAGCGSFSGVNPNVRIGVPPLRLPIQNILRANPIELIKRGLPTDLNVAQGSPLVSARYYYKPVLRITLTDYQHQLPRTVLSGDPPTAGSGPFGGVQLDGPDPWLAQNVGAGPGLKTTGPAADPNWYYQEEDSGTPNTLRPIPRGYQPKISDPTNGRPTGARINGNRIHGWIKVEIVRADGRTFDITQEILNLGVTVPYRANTGAAFYYPRAVSAFPPTANLDENSIIHLQRFAAPYTERVIAGLTALPMDPLNPTLDNVGGATGVNFDYYASMALRRYDTNAPASNLRMYGIRDDADTRSTPAGIPDYTTRFTGGSGNNPYNEPQPDPGGYYTHETRVPLPTNNPPQTEIDFRGNGSATRPAAAINVHTHPVAANSLPLSENVNLPKSRATLGNTGAGAVLNADGETTWFIGNQRLVPFPINMYDAREGLPHETANGTPTPVNGLIQNSPTKNGTMNLVEIDMGNLGRLFRGDFDNLFATMGQTPYSTLTGAPLRAQDLRDNIDVNQDNGWIVYTSDRRGDEPLLATNPNIKPGSGAVLPTLGLASVIGDGDYNREDVVWNPGGNPAGNAAALPVQIGGRSGCSAAVPAPVSDNSDIGKSPQDSNNDCWIQTETAANGFSETSPYNNMSDADQYNPPLTYTPALNSYADRRGAMVAMTAVSTNPKPGWSTKPPTTFQEVAANRRVEMFRRAVRIVNASNLFPTGPAISPQCNTPLGVTITSENPVYVFGNYNAPAAEVNDTDQYPGLNVTPVVSGANAPTSPARYNGQNFATCGNNCHVPSAIVADAITLLSGACVGAADSDWSTADGHAGWLDTRSFVTPYQAVGYRSARHTVYRFALVSGYTPSWFPGFWGNANIHQGPESEYISGALNNFPRFLEDWRHNGSAGQFTSFAGSLIRIYKSHQANGAFKRVSSAGNQPEVDYVYVPPNRDWIFDLDFNAPCTLPPGSPFLQLLDLRGFQQSVVQR
ncbi:MAG: hypothetical protein AB1489_16705 [Acidobacteriota bacterium]